MGVTCMTRHGVTQQLWGAGGEKYHTHGEHMGFHGYHGIYMAQQTTYPWVLPWWCHMGYHIGLWDTMVSNNKLMVNMGFRGYHGV